VCSLARDRAVTPLYLTNNLQLAGTARILLSWVTFGREHGTSPAAVLRGEGELADWLRRRDFPIVLSSMPALERRRPLPSLREAWRIARWARTYGVEIVHCNEHDVYPFGVLVARMLRVPAVCHVRFRINRAFAQWAFGGWRGPDALLWTTRQQQQDSMAAVEGVVPEDRQHLLPLGPDPLIFRPAGAERRSLRRQFDIADHEVAIGTATALRPVKRIEDFVLLIESLAARDSGVVGLIAGGEVTGEEAYRRDIEQRIVAAGLGRRLRWLGHLEPVERFLQSLDIFVSTSEYETFGNSVAEAMACGVPVVGYVGGSVHEIIGDAGAVVPNGDLAALTRCVAELADDPAARARRGDLGRVRVATEFSPARSFEKLRGLHEKLAAMNRPRFERA
jgi:glycosyltransferase involved in cell wall biosynthesis